MIDTITNAIVIEKGADVKRELTKRWKQGRMQVWLTDEKKEALRLKQAGECVVFVLTPDNREVFVPEIAYCVEVGQTAVPGETDRDTEGQTAVRQSTDWLAEMDPDYLEKVWQRHAGEPWNILDTERLTLREMTGEDLDSLYEIGDDADSRVFMEPLEQDRRLQQRKTEDYIRHMYGFYGFGIWMVELRSREGLAGDRELGGCKGLAGDRELGQCENRADGRKQPGTVIGRAGLQLREGFDEPELGFAIAPAFRGQGYAEEACRAVLAYGFSELELSVIRAVVHRENTKSLSLCTKLGFSVDKQAGPEDTMWISLRCRAEQFYKAGDKD